MPRQQTAVKGSAARTVRRGLGGLIGTAALYVGLPYLLVQIANLGVLRAGRSHEPTLALTFDDGPDPATTPDVLNALRDAGVQATFFMVGERALAHPALARRVADEGHEVAVHGHRHRHAWTRAPWAVVSDARLARRAVETATGRAVRYFRPPHGAYSLASLLALRVTGLTGAHWTVEAHDWHPGFTPDTVTRRVVEHAAPGAVVVMHDAGPGGHVAVRALPDLLGTLRQRGYDLRPLGALPGLRPERPRDLVPRALHVLDNAFDRKGHIRRVGVSATSLLRAGPAPFPLDGHPEFPKGTPMLEIHIDSERLVQIAAKPLRALKLVRESMRELAADVQADPEWRALPAVFSTGPFADVLVTLGYDIHDVPEAMRRRLTLWSSFLRWAHGTAHGPAREARLGLIRMDDLVRRHGR
jgi:peptidoglycan/xylan/chitin deacetylase (PgdA/CDA1 family)